MNWFIVGALTAMAASMWLVGFRVRRYRSEIALQQACLDCAMLWSSVITCTAPDATDDVRYGVYNRIKDMKIERLLAEYPDAVSREEVLALYKLTEDKFMLTTSRIHKSIEALKNARKTAVVSH